MTFDAAAKLLSVFVPVLTTVITGLIAAWARAAFARGDDRFRRLEERQSATEGEVADLREVTVRRKDFIRETVRQNAKLDALLQGQARLEGRAEIGNQIASAIRSLVDGVRCTAREEARDAGQG